MKGIGRLLAVLLCCAMLFQLIAVEAVAQEMNGAFGLIGASKQTLPDISTGELTLYRAEIVTGGGMIVSVENDITIDELRKLQYQSASYYNSTSTYAANVPVEYYGRAALSTLQNSSSLLKAYDKIVSAIESCQGSVNLYDCGLDANSLQTVFCAYHYDHTEHFWLENQFGYSFTHEGVYELYFTYNLQGQALNTARTEFESAVDRLLDGVSMSMSEFERERILHDCLAMKVTYDLNAEYAHNAYGAIVDGGAVCEGYAKAFQYLLQRVGIQSHIVTGFAGEDHAWNIVRIDGNYYHIDLTWDDGETRAFPILYTYFNKSDAEISADHQLVNLGYPLPQCNADSADYFTWYNAELDSYSQSEVLRLFKDSAQILDDRIIAHVKLKCDSNGFIDSVYRDCASIAKGLEFSGYTGVEVWTVDDINDGSYLVLILLGDTSGMKDRPGVTGDVIASGYCGAEGDGKNLSWKLTGYGKLTISGNGKMEIYDASNAYSAPAPWYEYHSRIRSVEFDGNVTSIGDYAFSGCEGLTSIIIPNSVICIGDWAFSNCTSMTDIYCEAASRPQSWNKNWNVECSATVHWGYNDGISDNIKVDLDGDGEFGESDLIVILNHIKGLSKLTNDQIKAADVNEDGRLDIRDYNLMFHALQTK